MYIIDDYNYINGEFAPLDSTKDLIIVVGGKGIGKSSYCKVMSFYTKDTNFFSYQKLSDLPPQFISKAKQIIELREVPFRRWTI